jgi:hypothetical protein
MHPNHAVPCATVIDMHMTACSELFAAYGLTEHLRPAACDDHDPARAAYASVLCATGEGIRLSSTLSLDRELLARTHPSGRKDVAERDIQDWCRELNNQLVGRLKNKLLRLGCEMATGLPVLLKGTDIVAVGAAEDDFSQYFFSSKYGCLAFTLALQLAPDLSLDARQAGADAEAVKLEGAMALF